MKNKWLRITLLILVFAMVFGSSVFAFQDVTDTPAEESIVALQKMGVVSGIDDKRFNPKGEVTFAQGIHMLVKAFDLNLNHFMFIKQPQASDYFTTISDDAWYANSFMVAQLNGLPLAKDVDPNKALTREEFANLLMKAIELKGDYAFIKIFMIIKDEQDITPEYMNSIQLLLIAKIIKLDNNQNFYPKQVLTRGEAATWLHKGIQFVHNASSVQPSEPQPEPQNPPHTQEEVKINVEKVTDDVQKVTLSWGMQPNPGYQLHISGIRFINNEAVIEYMLHYPDPNKFYAQVMTEAKDETFISSTYKISTKQVKAD